MHASKHIDWLSFTVPQSVDFRHVFPLLEWSFVSVGMHGYRAQYVNPQTRIRVDTDATSVEMGHHFTLSGDSLAILREDQGSRDTELCSRVIRFGARSSRIDLTINFHEGHLTPARLRDAVENGTAKTKSNRSRFITGRDKNIVGDTYYIGSPTSDRQLRCYDKAAELQIVDHAAWVRLELECRRLVANGALHSTAENGIEATVNGHFMDFLEWNDPDYRSALDGKSVEPEDIPRRLSDRQRWLLGQVTKALAKEIAIDETFKTVFLSGLDEEIKRLSAT